jgi:HTH-type transcriptional regulator/antitoxin HigA
MDEMGTLTISPKKYGGLLAKTLPKVIETDRELEHFAEVLESLDRLERGLSPEEKALETLLSQLIRDYDERIELPKLSPHKTIAFLMEQRGLKQADLLPVFGSRSVASDVLNGKREPSKNHIRKLAEFFRLSPEVFF